MKGRRKAGLDFAVISVGLGGILFIGAYFLSIRFGFVIEAFFDLEF